MMTIRNNKRLLNVLAAALLMTAVSCNRAHDEVYSTYADGSPKLVFSVVEGRDNLKTRVGEKFYYENGKLMYEKHFKDDKPAGEWKFYHENGTMFASGSFDRNNENGSDWVVHNEQGADYYDGAYDSVAVLELTADHRPLSIAYYKDSMEMRYQFNDNYTLNAKGQVVNGRKEGRWEFYYATGQKMLEAVYHDGAENGAYNSFRENGIPYFLGFYINGKRAGVWEIYDEAGNLAARQDFDTH